MSSTSTTKTDAIQSIHYQSTADAIRDSQQPLNVYQVQLRPIKSIRHHNVCRHSDEGRGYNKASLKSSAKWSCGHWVGCQAQRPSYDQKEVPFMSFIWIPCVFSPSMHRAHPVCRHIFGIMLHVQVNCAAKRIISVHCMQPVNQSSLCDHHNHPSYLPPHHLHPGHLFPRAHLQCTPRARS